MKNEPANERWFGDLPPSWSTVRLGSLGTFAKGRGGSKEDNRESGVPVVRYGDLYTKFGIKITQPAAFVSDDDSLKYTPLPKNTLVFSASGEDAAEIGKAAVSLLDERAVVGGDTVLFTPARDTDPVYLAYALESHPSRAQKTVRATGFTVVHISAGRLKTISLPIPSLAEQRAIAGFLDHETALIDTLIEKQHALIERLRERRDATIKQTLTQGVGEPAALRSSEVPFLGDVPAHWRTVPSRYLCSITTGSEDSGNADPDGAFPFFVRGREVLRSDSFEFDGEAVMTPGDGQGGTGKVFHYYDGKFQAHQRVYVFHSFRGILGRYYHYWLSTFFKPIALASSLTVTMESLRRPVLAGFRVALPPLEEQRVALDHLDRETAKIDELIGKVEQHIELARERRSALITAAVTGQIEVGA